MFLDDTGYQSVNNLKRMLPFIWKKGQFKIISPSKSPKPLSQTSRVFLVTLEEMD